MDLFLPEFQCLICGAICEGMPAHGCNNKLTDWKRIKPKVKRCKNCHKEKGSHKAKTFECPSGLKTRIGYIHFGPTKYEQNH